MTPTTAQAILEYVKKFNVPAKPNVDESEGVIKVWLRRLGWAEDRWGNFLDPADPTTRYHFKKTQLNKQSKGSGGDWSNLSYTSTIDSALSLIVSAAGVVGDQEMVAKYSKTKGKRREEKKSRADAEQEKRQRKEAYALAMKEYSAQRRGFVERMLQGKTKDEEVLKAREEFDPILARWLAVVKDGTVPEDDQQFATADAPPVLPVLGTAEYEWIETVGGVEYTVTIKSADKNIAEISIGGSPGHHAVSALTHRMTFMDLDAKGDAYISGKVSYKDGKYHAALFMIISTDKQKGAGTRALSIWCRLMAGYGVKYWVAEGVGDEGASFFLALEKKGNLKLHVRQGPNWILECLSEPAQNPVDKNTKLPKGYSYSRKPIRESEIRIGDTVEMSAPDKFNVSYGCGGKKVLKKGRVNFVYESFTGGWPGTVERRQEIKAPLAHIENVLRGKVVYPVDHSQKNPLMTDEFGNVTGFLHRDGTVDRYAKPKRKNPSPAPTITLKQAQDTGKKLGVNWKTSVFDAEQFQRGMQIELEHGDRNDTTNLTGDDLIATAMIALAHLNEHADYYYRLDDMEVHAEREEKARTHKPRVTMKVARYRDKPGYTIYGTNDQGGSFKVFIEGKEMAEKIRDEYKAARPGYEHRIHALMVGKAPMRNPAPPDLQGIAKRMKPQWEKFGVTSVGTGFVLPEGGTHGQWSLYAWTRDLDSSRRNLPSEVKGYPVMIRDVPRAYANPASKSKPGLRCGCKNPSAEVSHVLHKKVFHVGTMAGRKKRPSMSLEGPGVSVSMVPNAWAQIAKLGRSQLNVLTRKDGKAGRFVDLTGKKVMAAAPLAVAAGYVKAAEQWRFFHEGEDGEELYSDFPSQAKAEEEMEGYGEGRVEQVDGYVATPKLKEAWKKDFSGRIPGALDIGVLYALEESTDFDGAWWDEDLDPYALSAPRGVIFRSKLPEWTFKKIDWEKAPDANSEF